MGRKRKEQEVNVTEMKEVVPDVQEEKKEESAPAQVADKIKEIEQKMAALSDEISTKVSEWNDAHSYDEHTLAGEIEKQIADKVSEYSTLAESKCFEELMGAENIMLAAAIKLRYNVIKVRDTKPDPKSKEVVKVVETSSVLIDPARLDKKVKGGIGANKEWSHMIERLNYLQTCRLAIELGLDTAEISKTYAMKEEALKIEVLLSETDPTKYDKNAADEILMKDMQTVVNAMLGEGYTVAMTEAMYFVRSYAKKNNKKSLQLVCSNHRTVRGTMLEICHKVVTGAEYSVSYKVKK